MKATGIVRRIDDLGRVVIPKSIRYDMMKWDNDEALEIFVDGDSVCLKKYYSEEDENIQIVKSIMVENKVFNTDIIRAGQKIYFGFRTAGELLYNEGYGEILQVHEHRIYIKYNGNSGEIYTSITPKQIENGEFIFKIQK